LILKKSILIIGSGYNQLNLIRSAKELGYTTVVVDIMGDSPGKTLSDFFYVLPAADFGAHCEIIQKHDVKGIATTQMEKPLQFMAKLAAKYGFNFPKEESVLWARNKFRMKQRFFDYSVACAKGILIRSKDEITKETLRDLKFPLIIKPVDSFSSRGVYKVNDIKELKDRFDITKTFSSDATVVVEEFISGNMISVEGFVFHDKINIIQFTERYKFTPAPMFVELGHIQPATISSEEKETVTKLISDVVAALQLNNCGFHAELKLTDKGPYIIEIGARLGGDFNASHLVPNSTGINIEKAIAAVAMNDEPVLPPRNEQFSMIKWIEFPASEKVKTINKIELPKELKNNIIEYNILLKEGDEIPTITDSSKRKGYVVVKGKNRNEVIAASSKMEKIMLDSVSYY
jgi:carbamoyl-phosphate synthase large subunit